MDGERSTDQRRDMGARMFDPRPHVRRIQVRGQEAEYLDVKWRLAWLRTEHPDARISTEHVTLTEDLAVFRATVEIPSGGAATGYGSETRADFEDFIEKAETKAIGRALAALGYGTQFALDFDLESTPTSGDRPALADAPIERPSPPPARREPPQLRPVPPQEPEPAPSEPPPSVAESRDPAPAAPSRPTRAAAPSDREARATSEVGRPDRNWTALWTELRRLGYQSKADLEALLGHPIDTGTTLPSELWEEVMAYRRKHGLED